ncbi:hypothetical protein C8R46DRAFT_1052433 [Mycena filopes]|nr:hypothetical protein C8R46DRAFT_1052433 [Mycena filopes]
MSVLPPPWPSQPWISQSSFSALAAPVIPPLDPSDHSPFPSPTHAHSPFSALAASPPRHFTHPMHTSRHQQSPVPIPGPSFAAGLPQHNERPLDKPALLQILSHLSPPLAPFRRPGMRQIRLVVHGGAVMLLNPALAHLPTPRTTTRDIDYIARAFSAEWASSVPDANDRLRQCIFETAAHFGLGTDWMNSDADVALPMASNPTTGALYDPIHAAALTANGGTVYTSPNGLLKLGSSPPNPPVRAT